MSKICRKCGVELNIENTTPSAIKAGHYKCRNCINTEKASIKEKILSYYGGGSLSCCDCDYDDVRGLTIDHICGGGRKHHNEIGPNTYNWLMRNNLPDGYQTLCFNCNFIKRSIDNCYISTENIPLLDQSSKNGYMALWRLKIKERIMRHYSGGSAFCGYCGYDDMRALTIDHIDGTGSEHRRQIKTKGGGDFFLWLKRNNFPDGFQVLCMCCNFIKRIENKEHGKRKSKQLYIPSFTNNQSWLTKQKNSNEALPVSLQKSSTPKIVQPAGLLSESFDFSTLLIKKQ
jgi:hypothetical protein